VGLTCRDRLVLVVPGDVASPSGGNVWDRRVADALAAHGEPPTWVPVPGGWPDPSPEDLAGLDRALAEVPDGAPVLLDGLVGCSSPDVVDRHAGRLRLGVVLHLPLALETGLDHVTAAARDRAERRVLAAVYVVLATSRWTAARLAEQPLRRPPVVAAPGTDPTTLHPAATTAGGQLLCLAAVTPRKGQRRLVRALDLLRGVMGTGPTGWSLRLVGPQPDVAEVTALRREVEAAGLAHQVRLLGPLVGEDLEEQWRQTDLLVVPSHVETYGMVVTEALARGRPVLATTGSALPEALGTTAAGPPGLLVPPGDADALAGALGRWLVDGALRADLRGRARERAGTLSGWELTARAVRQALA